MSALNPLGPASASGRWSLSIAGSVLIHVGAAAGGIWALQTQVRSSNTADTPPPSFAISIETLAPTTLAGVTTVTPDPDITPETAPPETLPSVEPDTPEDPVDTPTPQVDPVTPEIEDPVAVPALPVAPPTIAAPIATDPVVALPIAPAPGIAAPVTSPITGTVTSQVTGAGTSVSPSLAITSPINGPGPSGGQGSAAPITGESTIVAANQTGTRPEAPVGSVVPPSQARPTVGSTTPPAAPSVQDIAITALIDRVQVSDAAPCALALPRRAGNDAAALALIGTEAEALDTLARGVLTGDLAQTEQTRALIDTRQCPVLDWLADTRDYPATRLGLRLDARVVNSGTSLTGIVQGVSGQALTLLLIDDNGVVQDLARWTTISGNLARFDAPVTRDGPSRETRQIVLALATRQVPQALRQRLGQLAQDVFTGLPDDLSNARFGFETVDIR